MGRAVAAVSRAWPAEPWEDPACFALPQAAAVRCSAWRALRLGLLCLVLRLRDCAQRDPRGLPWRAFLRAWLALPRPGSRQPLDFENQIRFSSAFNLHDQLSGRERPGGCGRGVSLAPSPFTLSLSLSLSLAVLHSLAFTHKRATGLSHTRCLKYTQYTYSHIVFQSIPILCRASAQTQG